MTLRQTSGTDQYTGSIERFSAKESIRKILKVSHFYLAFSPNKNNIETKILNGFH